MVMVTRSAFKRASESWNSDISEKNIIPPWCSSGRGHVHKRDVYIKSVYPPRENIWNYLNDNENLKRKTVKLNKQILIKRSKSRNAKLLMIPLALGLIITILLSPNSPKTFISFLSKSKMSLPPSCAIEQCCGRMSLLTLQLNRAERALRNTLRVRKVMLISLNNMRDPTIQRGYIAGAKVTKGRTTTEWGGNVALWGVVPLWRVSPPPDTVLALRPPTPADCWPFRGSYGEIIIQLPRRSLVQTASVEHVRPDTTRSAPKHFTLFSLLQGILENGTWIKSADGEYSYNKPAKQYFLLTTKNVPLKQLVFRVLSNQGNTKYTCIYRVHLYNNINLVIKQK